MVMERREGERKMRGKERDRELSVSRNLNIFRSVTEEVREFHFQLVRQRSYSQYTCVYSFSHFFLGPSLDHLVFSLLISTSFFFKYLSFFYKFLLHVSVILQSIFLLYYLYFCLFYYLYFHCFHYPFLLNFILIFSHDAFYFKKYFSSDNFEDFVILNTLICDFI